MAHRSDSAHGAAARSSGRDMWSGRADALCGCDCLGLLLLERSSTARSAPPDQLRAPPDQLLGLLLGLQDRGEPRPPPPVRSSWSRPPAPHAARGSSRHTLTHVHVAATREPLLALATEKQWRRGALPGARPFAASSPACRRRGVGRHRNGRFAAINVRVVPLWPS